MAQANNRAIVSGRLGLYDRGDQRLNPPNSLVVGTNIMFTDPDGTITRLPAKLALNFAPYLGANLIKNFAAYRRIGESVRYIILDSAGNFYDSGAGSPGTPILTLSGSIDFSSLTLFNHFYFTVHDTVTGLTAATGGFLYVYDPDLGSVARKAAGVRPTTQLTLAASATNGVVEPGQHILAYSFVTNSGFVTKPGGHQIVTMPAGTRKKIDVTNISVGGAAVTKRWIWLSKALQFYDNNLENPELFFVKEIADNVTTSQTGANGIDAYDSALVASADKYSFNLEEIPAGTALCVYSGSLVSVGENANRSYARVSQPGEPEVFSSIDGFISAAPGDGEGLKNCKAISTTLLLFKSMRTLFTFRTEDPPNAWPTPDILDVGNGAEFSMIAEILDSSTATIEGGLIIANANGLHHFTGHFPVIPLSFNISDAWTNVVRGSSSAELKSSNVIVDSVKKRIYVQIGNTLFFADYSNGLTKDAIAWSKWTLPGNPTRLRLHAIQSPNDFDILIVFANLVFGASTGTQEIRSLDEAGIGVDSEDNINGVITYIPWEIETSPVNLNDFTVKDHLQGIVIQGSTVGGEVEMKARNNITGREVAILPNIDAGGLTLHDPLFRNVEFTDKYIAVNFKPRSSNPANFNLMRLGLTVDPEAEADPQ